MYVIVLLPIELEVELQVGVVFRVGLASHAQVFKGEITLLMDVPVVVLRDFGWWDAVFRPYLFYS